MSKYFQRYINDNNGQNMTIAFDGFNYEAIRTDSDGYKTSLVMNKFEKERFVSLMLEHGWKGEL